MNDRKDFIIRDEATSDKLVLGNGLSVGLTEEPSGRKFVALSIFTPMFVIREMAVSEALLTDEYVNLGYSLDTVDAIDTVIKKLESLKDDITPVS